MRKRKIRQKIANTLKGVHPLFKFFSLLTIFLALSITKSFLVVFIWFLLTSVYILYTDIRYVSQIKTIAPLISIIAIYSIFLAYSSTITITQVLYQSLFRLLLLLSIFNFSFIFIRNTSKYQLIKITTAMLYPFNLFIDRNLLIKIIMDTINFTPIILKKFKELLSKNLKNSKSRLTFILKITDMLSDFFIEVLNNPPLSKTISENRIKAFITFKRPVLEDYLFISIVVVLSIGSIAI